MSNSKSFNINRKEFEPQNAILKNFLYSYWVFEFDGESNSDSIISVPPMGMPIIHINLGKSDNFYPLPNSNIKSLIIGQVQRHVFLRPNTGMKLVVINFKPYGLYNWIGLTPPHGDRNSIEACEVFGNEKIADLINLMTQAENDSEMLNLLENFLIINKNERAKRYDLMDSIVDEIVAMNGLVSINDVIKKRCSLRTFQRYFSEVIGAGPKTFTRILRHKYIIQLMYRNPEVEWNDLVFAGYYFDHSHFIKDFYSFSNIKPSQYELLKTSIVADYLI